jgi:hypothetical protein
MTYASTRKSTLFLNAAICNEQYKPMNKPVVLEWEDLLAAHNIRQKETSETTFL